MSELFFVFKTMVITVAVVLLMQIKIGKSTIEEHSITWIQTSSVADNLRAVAQGAVVAAEKGYDFIVDAVRSGMGSSEGRSRRNDGPMGDEID